MAGLWYDGWYLVYNMTGPFIHFYTKDTLKHLRLEII